MELQYERIVCDKVVNITALASAQYLEMPKDFTFQLETHRCWEINFIDNGSIRLYADGKKFELQKQDMILYAPMVEHGILEKTENTPNTISFSFESDSPSLYRLAQRVIHLSPQAQKMVSNILKYAFTLSDTALPVNKLTTVLQNLDENRRCLLQMIVVTLEALLLQLLTDSYTSVSAEKILKTTVENQQSSLSQAVQAYIEQHLDEKLTLEKISHHFNISPGKLYRDIKSVNHCSLQTFIADIRLKAAKRLIRQEEYNFTEIAQQLGFSSLHYFSQWFKTHTHFSPTEYATSMKSRSER